MNDRSHALGTAVALAALAFAAGSVKADPPLPAPEESLLGVHLLARYSDVLHKFGQPSDIQVGAPIAPADQSGSAPGMGLSGGGMMGGRMGGGMPGMGGGMMMGGKMGGMMGGMTPGGMSGGMSGPPGMPGGMRPGMGGGLPGFAGGAGGGMTPGGMMGGKMGGMMGGMMPGGMGGPPGMPGGYSGGGGLPGFNAGSNQSGLPGGIGSGVTPPVQDDVSTETTWWYRYPKSGLYYAFLFNKDGKVIQIQEYGWSGGKGSATRQGIALGSNLGQLIRKYGWSENGDRTGDSLTLRYGGRRRLAFQVVRNKVAGITLAVGQ